MNDQRTSPDATRIKRLGISILNPANAGTQKGKDRAMELGGKLLSGKNSRVGNGWLAFWVIIALLVDLVTLIPVVGDFVSPVFWLAVAYFLFKKGCGVLNPSRVAVELVAWLAKMIPVIQEFPETTIGIVLVMLLIRFEDRTGIKALSAISEGGMDAALKPGNTGPMNQGGVRQPSLRQAAPANVDGVRQAAPETPREMFDRTHTSSGADPEADLAKAQAKFSQASTRSDEFAVRDVEEAQAAIKMAQEQQKLKEKLGAEKYAEHQQQIMDNAWNEMNEREGRDENGHLQDRSE